SAVACQAMKEAIENIDQQVVNRVWGDRSADLASVEPVIREFDKQLGVQIQKSDLVGESEATNRLRDLWQKYRVNLPYIFSLDHTDVDRRNSYLVTVQPLKRDVLEAAQRLVEMNMND